MRWGTVAALIPALAAVLLWALQPASNHVAGRRSAPALPTQVLVPPRVTVTSLRGRPAFINFWASWCAPCTRETPQLQRFARLVGGRASIVGVDWGDGVSSARRFIARFTVRYPILRDADDATGARFGLTGLPTTYVLDSSGRVALTLYGPQTMATLDRALKTALS